MLCDVISGSRSGIRTRSWQEQPPLRCVCVNQRNGPIPIPILSAQSQCSHAEPAAGGPVSVSWPRFRQRLLRVLWLLRLRLNLRIISSSRGILLCPCCCCWWALLVRPSLFAGCVCLSLDLLQSLIFFAGPSPLATCHPLHCTFTPPPPWGHPTPPAPCECEILLNFCCSCFDFINLAFGAKAK